RPACRPIWPSPHPPSHSPPRLRAPPPPYPVPSCPLRPLDSLASNLSIWALRGHFNCPTQKTEGNFPIGGCAPAPKADDEVSKVPALQRRRSEVLRGVRDTFGPDVQPVRPSTTAVCEVLSGVRPTDRRIHERG